MGFHSRNALTFILMGLFAISRPDPVEAQSGDTVGFLTQERSADDPLDIALSYVERNRRRLKLRRGDLSDLIVADRYTSRHNGVTHIYLRQRYRGIEVVNGDMNINIARDGRVINLGNAFVRNLRASVNARNPKLEAAAAAARAAKQLGLSPSSAIDVVESRPGPAREARLSRAGISLEDIPVKLVYYQVGSRKVRLAWDMVLRLPNQKHWWNLWVDARTGRILSGADWMANDTYEVFALPKEHPNDGPRTVELSPANALASPFGWHDTDGVAGHEFTDTRGNNVFAQEDTNANNSGGFRPDGGAALNFQFALDLQQQPSTYQAAAITNLFYWNNILHDVLYQYGFDESSGNFQQNNYGRAGQGAGDPVQADAQDGSGTNNANFATPPDGQDPRMQMFVWTSPPGGGPNRDSDLDNGIIAHEYGHGVSNRLTGGPQNVGCLTGRQSGGMGEGWSDFLGLVLTATATDQATDRRGIGTYVLFEPPNGDGIRQFPYTTDMNVNPHTFQSIRNVSVPHGVGSVWAAMLWEVYWNLVTAHGFDNNLYTGVGGNNIALQLVLDGMKLQKCRPTFRDARDAILLADQTNNNGANVCLIWEGFAKRGLGVNARGAWITWSLRARDGFDVPASCSTAAGN